MLKVADYRMDGLKLRVRLKCSCGGRRVLKIIQNNEVEYQCANCKAQTSLHKLKSEASTYWKGRPWDVECEEPKKPTIEPISANYPARLVASAGRDVEPYCTLTGRCTELSNRGALFVAQDFKKSYFEGMSSRYRSALIQWIAPIHGLPRSVWGTITEVKFREDELPVAHVRVAFENLAEGDEKQLLAHIEDLRGRVTEWTIG
jgi:hypothetical protein